MNDRISFPLRPMVGVIGVATERETLFNGFAGQHGGNLDNHLHGPGATVYLPVRQPGGMLAIGDMHASMGDGEVCFTGVEIAGEVTIRVGLLKGEAGHVARDRARRPLGRARHGGRRTSWRRSTGRSRKARASSSTSGASRWRKRSSSSRWPVTRTSARLAGRRSSRRSRAFPFRRCQPPPAVPMISNRSQRMPEPDRGWKALAIVCAAFFMTVLDVSIVNVALPSIGKALHFSEANLQWVITAYAITFGGFLLLGGRAADLLGRRRVFLRRRHGVHGRVVPLRARLVGGRADRRARLAGARRGDHLARSAVDHHDDASRKAPSATRRSGSGARSAAPAPRSACSPAAC